MAISPEGGVHLGRNYNPCDEVGARCSLWVIVNHDAPNRLPLSTPGLLKQQVSLTKNAADSFGCGNIADSGVIEFNSEALPIKISDTHTGDVISILLCLITPNA